MPLYEQDTELDDSPASFDLRSQKAPKPKKSSGSFGWMGRVFTRAGNERSHQIALNPNLELIVPQAYPLKTAASTPQQILAACQLACQGAALKTIARAIVGNPVVDLTLSLGTSRVFGAHVRITDSLLNFKPGTFTVQLLDGATVLNECVVLVGTGIVDIVLFAIANNGGQASIPGAAVPNVRIIASGGDYVAASTAIFAESLNMRDIGNIAGNIEGTFATQ